MIIGASPSPTPYKIRTYGAEHYLRCGADILLNGFQRNLEGEATCVVCGSMISLKISEQEIRELEPTRAVLHVVEIPLAHGRLGIECEGSPLFDKEDCLHTWLKSYRGRPGAVFKPQEYLDRIVRVRSRLGLTSDARLDVQPL